MNKAAFIDSVRSLFNIDGYLLPELSLEEQKQFLRDPVHYLLNADDAHADAIMREIERRQAHGPVIAAAISSASKAVNATKPARAKKPKRRVDGQRELLLPILGNKPAEESKPSQISTPRQKAG